MNGTRVARRVEVHSGRVAERLAAVLEPAGTLPIDQLLSPSFSRPGRASERSTTLRTACTARSRPRAVRSKGMDVVVEGEAGNEAATSDAFETHRC